MTTPRLIPDMPETDYHASPACLICGCCDVTYDGDTACETCQADPIQAHKHRRNR